MSNTSPIIGIDLGTTCCCVAHLNADQTVDILENTEGDRTTPSYVAFIGKTNIIGKIAKEELSKDKENTVYDAKRLIGQKFDNKLLQQAKKHSWPFKMASSDDDNISIEITRNGDTEKYKPQDISAILLKYMKTIAEERLDAEVKDAVITVPAYFNYHQRTATKEAAELAGLNIIKLINEPTAAALAYIHKNKISGEAKHFLVFDLGGGTLDVSIVALVGKSVTVKATAGNTALGGRDFDNNLAKFVADNVEKLCKRPVNVEGMQKISALCEIIKKRLSLREETSIILNSLINGEDFDYTINRTDFNRINSELFQICIHIVENCLKDAKLNKTDIDKILLVGGSTRIPKIQEMLTKFFDGKQLTKAINPDEAVAYGAAVQAAILSKGNKTELDYEVDDVTPLSLGTDVQGDLMSIIIPRNSKIPISKTETFLSIHNKQKRIKTSIYEGERSLVEYNTLIGSTVLILPPKPPGYPIDITFHVNDNGILEVSAKTGDGIYHNLAIHYEKLNINTVTDVLNDAEENKPKDTKIMKNTQKWINLKKYWTKMEALCDYDKKGITEEEKNTIRTACQKVNDWMYENTVKDGSPQEETTILNKLKEIESVCEPIVNFYGYYVKNMELNEFHTLISE